MRVFIKLSSDVKKLAELCSWKFKSCPKLCLYDNLLASDAAWRLAVLTSWCSENHWWSVALFAFCALGYFVVVSGVDAAHVRDQIDIPSV